MDDHKDLVARLWVGTNDGPRAWDLMREAAVAIERLTKERDEARAALKRLSS